MKQTFYNVLLFVFVIFNITSCKNGRAETNLDSLTIGVMSSMDYLPLAVAQKEGYFEKVGLKLKIQKFYSANDRDAAFQSGSIDGTVIDFTGAVLQKAGGIDLKITSQCNAPFYIIADSKSGITSIADLKGKEVAISQNTVIDFIVDMALKSVNLTDSDISKIEVNKIPLRFEMLVNNKINATGLPNPFALMAQAEGCQILTSNDSLGFAITGIVFQQSSIDTKTDLIRKMYEAYNMGADYLNKHNAIDVQNILVDDIGFPENLISDLVLPKYKPAELPTEKDIQTTTDWLINKGLVPSGFDPNTVLDSRFVQVP